MPMEVHNFTYGLPMAVTEDILLNTAVKWEESFNDLLSSGYFGARWVSMLIPPSLHGLSTIARWRNAYTGFSSSGLKMFLLAWLCGWTFSS